MHVIAFTATILHHNICLIIILHSSLKLIGIKVCDDHEVDHTGCNKYVTKLLSLVNNNEFETSKSHS